MKNNYMNSQEFKERQGFFDFFCRASVDYLVAFKKHCRAGWRKLFSCSATKQAEQIVIMFSYPIAQNWMQWEKEKNLQLFA